MRASPGPLPHLGRGTANAACATDPEDATVSTSRAASSFAHDVTPNAGPREAPTRPEDAFAEAPRRGRPPLMDRAQALAAIRSAAERGELFRVHLEQPALYARARRMWGSWGAALEAAGVDYGQVMTAARRRSLDGRRSRHGGPAR